METKTSSEKDGVNDSSFTLFGGVSMGYYVRFIRKAKPPCWKLQFVSYKKASTLHSVSKKPKCEWDIPRERWASLGFQPTMTLEQARSRAKQLSAQREIKRQEIQRRKIEKDQARLGRKFTAAFPEVYKTEFEQKHIWGRNQTPDWKKRFMVSWRAVQRMLIEIQLDPVDWFDESYQFYDYFRVKSYSMSYVKKTLVILNIWGQFLSRRLGQVYFRVPIPRGTERARIIEAYFKKCGGRVNQSDPLTPEQLADKKKFLSLEQYNWLYLSV